MPTLSVANPTILDVANRTMPDGTLDRQIVEMLHQQNQTWDEATVLEANDGTSYKTTVRTGIPEGTWRQMYGGVPEKKSTTAQVRDSTGMLENYATIDKALADQNGGSASWRLTEESPFIEGMNQQAARTLFYGDTTLNQERFMGLAPRFAHSTAAESGQNIIKAGGAGADNTSIWLVTWHPTTCFLFYPKGSKAGLSARDLGEQTVYDASGNPFQAYRTHYKHDLGVCVRDWRAIGRVANIDVGDLTKDAATGADLVDLMTQLLEMMPDSAGMGRKAFYCNKTIRSILRRQIKNAKNMNLSLETVAGKKVVMFDDVPVRRVDQITNAEALVP
jgi:hypothetical protein